jgi:hypothetical protein
MIIASRIETLLEQTFDAQANSFALLFQQSAKSHIALSCCVTHLPDGIDRYLVLRCQLRELIIQSVCHIQQRIALMMQRSDNRADPMRVLLCKEGHFRHDKIIQLGALIDTLPVEACFFIFRILRLFCAANQRERFGNARCRLMFQEPATIFQIADDMKVIVAQYRLWQCDLIAFDKAFGAIDNAGIRRIATRLKIK